MWGVLSLYCRLPFSCHSLFLAFPLAGGGGSGGGGVAGVWGVPLLYCRLPFSSHSLFFAQFPLAERLDHAYSETSSVSPDFYHFIIEL